MFRGLKNAHKKSTMRGEVAVQSSADKTALEKLLASDFKTRKNFYSKFQWYFDKAKISNRQGAETTLKQASAKGNQVFFLIRSSTACDDDFVLSFTHGAFFIHYQINFDQAHCTYYMETGPHFNGLNELVDYYSKDNTELSYKLTTPCPNGQPPPPHTISEGYTNILHKAINEGNTQQALWIISHPQCPQLDERDGKGSMALHLACIKGLDSVVEALVLRGATVSAVDKQKYTPLQLTCKYNQANAGHILMVRGFANPQRRLPDSGNVALHVAAQLGHIQTVKMLLELDVPCHSRNFDQKTPYQLAMANGHTNCAQLLDNYIPPPASTSQEFWYHGDINRQQSMELLDKNGCTEGLFLVRKSSREPDKLVLDVCFSNQKMHYVINSFMSTYFIDAGPLLPSLDHLIEYYCFYADGLNDTLSTAISPGGSLIAMSTYDQKLLKKAPLPLIPDKDSTPPVPMEPMVLERTSITTGHELGQGEYGSVMKGTWKAADGQTVPVAIKTLNEQNMSSGKEEFLREAQVMVKLDHPCIVRLIGICQGPPLMLVQELLALGSMLDFLLDYPEKVNINTDLSLWASQIANGMRYLEKVGFVHRDLAARNILLASKKQVKICDFGLSRATGAHSDYYRASRGGKWPVKWYAPESINYGTFSSASDVWSFGVTLWEMFSFGEQPYGDKTGAQVIQMLERKGRLKCPEKCPQNLFILMKRCWEYNAPDRPTFNQIYQELNQKTGYENVSMKASKKGS